MNEMEFTVHIFDCGLFLTQQNDEFAGGPLLCQTSQGEPWSLVAVSTENRYCDATLFGQDERTYHAVSAIAQWVLETLRSS